MCVINSNVRLKLTTLAQNVSHVQEGVTTVLLNHRVYLAKLDIFLLVTNVLIDVLQDTILPTTIALFVLELIVLLVTAPRSALVAKQGTS